MVLFRLCFTFAIEVYRVVLCGLVVAKSLCLTNLHARKVTFLITGCKHSKLLLFMFSEYAMGLHFMYHSDLPIENMLVVNIWYEYFGSKCYLP